MEPFKVNMQFYGPRASDFVLSLYSDCQSEERPSRRSVAGMTARVWCKRGGTIHRTGGPALEYSDGQKFWFVHGKGISMEIPPWDGGFIGFWGGGGKAMYAAPMSMVGKFPMQTESSMVEDRQ